VGLVLGRIVDALGQPLADCEVAFLGFSPAGAFDPAPTRPALATAKSDASGRFHLALDTSDGGMVTLRHRDFPPRVAALGLEVAAGTTKDLGDLTLFSQPGLRVHVRTAAGVDVADALVTAAPAMQDVTLPTAIHALAERAALTDPTGEAVLYGVAPGPYVVRVEAAAGATTETNHLQPDHPADAPRIELSLEVGHTIRGRVVPPDGVEPGRVMVTAEPAGGGVVLRGEAGARGDFRLTGATAGRYRVWVESARLGSAVAETAVPSNTPLTVALGVGQSLRGVVRDDATGAPVTGALVVAQPEDGWPLTRAGEAVRPDAVTDARGEFCVVGLPAGRFVLTVTSEWFVPARLAPIAAGTEPIEVRLVAGLSITGRARCNGAPVAGASVRAISWSKETTAFAMWRSRLAATSPQHETQTDADGSFRLAGVPTQGRRLVIEAADCVLWASQPLTGSKGQSLDLGTIALTAGAVVEGTAAPLATVALQSRGGDSLAYTTTADLSGRFVFRALPAGDYELFYHSAANPRRGAAAASLATEKTVVALQEGERKTVTLKD